MIEANINEDNELEDCPYCGGSGMVQPKPKYRLIIDDKNFCQCGELSRKTVNEVFIKNKG